jgi:hypothetical protein
LSLSKLRFKRVVLSKEETEEIIGYNGMCLEFFLPIHIRLFKKFYFSAVTIPCLRWPEESLMVDHKLRCTKDKVGLLSKIVAVIKQEPPTASFRYF